MRARLVRGSRHAAGEWPWIVHHPTAPGAEPGPEPHEGAAMIFDVHHGRRWRHVLAGGMLGLAALLAAACGSSHPGNPSAEVAGQVAKSQLPSSGSGGKGSSTSSTIPLAQSNPITALFTALSSFQSCLSGLGVTFIGAPVANDPSSPTNNPSYVKSLTTCATRSDILQALQNEQNAQNNLTLAQIHTENQEYLKWRTCMLGKGWSIPTPTPNAKGLLFSFGGGAGSVTNITPPPGKSLLDTGDMQACASKAIG